ncbi:fimbrial biogenesis chaperone, partial [Acinetobacter baumannii]|uniref:fimbrial biogenesis chaperone n=1 Tax=Acinetobacter baumannii TaxID=470 RepID=UPI0013D73C0A
VQVQVDDGSEKKPADEEDSNFLLTPNIFRMEPGSAQTVLLKYIGNSLPQNKESIFYMNFTQLPASKSEKSGSNQLVLAITNRVKIFYRPQG